MSQLGRIGGPVLSADLLRDGNDLAFETDLLYLSVTDLSNPLKTVGLGINNNSPSQKLQITGTSHFAKSDPLFPTDWIINTQADLADLVFLTHKIQNPTGKIFIRPDQLADPTIVTNEIRTSKLKLVDSSISTLINDDHIEITANGTGDVEFYTIKVKINGDLQVTGNLQVTGTSTFETAGIRIIDNKITAIATNTDLVMSANGAGGVILDSRLKITDNTISNVWSGATSNSQKSIYFTPNGTGNVVIDSTKSIQIPVSNDSDRVLTALGEVRLNSTTQVFEGKIAGGIIPLNGIYDTDRNTYITPELTLGANDNTLRFYNNNTLTTRINTSALLNNLIHVDDIRLSGNTVNNRIANNDLIFAPNGTGAVNLNNISFPENAIRNNTNGALTFNSTGVGYVKFSGTYGVIIPIGTGDPVYAPGTPQNQRPLTAEVGAVRHNTSLVQMEVFDGTNWIPATGTATVVSVSEIIEIMDFWSLVLG